MPKASFLLVTHLLCKQFCLVQSCLKTNMKPSTITNLLLSESCHGDTIEKQQPCLLQQRTGSLRYKAAYSNADWHSSPVFHGVLTELSLQQVSNFLKTRYSKHEYRAPGLFLISFMLFSGRKNDGMLYSTVLHFSHLKVGRS